MPCHRPAFAFEGSASPCIKSSQNLDQGTVHLLPRFSAAAAGLPGSLAAWLPSWPPGCPAGRPAARLPGCLPNQLAGCWASPQAQPRRGDCRPATEDADMPRALETPGGLNLHGLSQVTVNLASKRLHISESLALLFDSSHMTIILGRGPASCR